MGNYINKGNSDFAEARDEKYVDKSGLVAFVNKALLTQERMICVSRARRFGKSLALQMLYAYYDCSCDSHSLFDDLAIANDASYEKHLNKYYTIHLDITSFITGASAKETIVDEMVERVIEDIKEEFPDVRFPKRDKLMDVLLSVATQKGRKFVMLIDEWDALCREASDKPELLKQYINLLRNLFKGDNTNRVFAGVYMTGILPIKSYGTQSALNNFRMYSMVNPEPIESFYGFTEAETKELCRKFNLDYQELAHWYNGYQLGINNTKIFNPTSVMTMLTTGVCKGYWTQTESFESVRDLINMNFDGVKEALESMLTQQPAKVTVSTFGNDSNVIGSKDELFTLLIHYGYLGYDAANQRAFIPNSEVRQELVLAIKNGQRPELIRLIQDSEMLVQKTLDGDEAYVAQTLDTLHTSKVAPKFYNNEQALRSLIHQAYIAAIDDYVQIQELPSGTGYADVVFIPRKRSDRPAMIVELKFGGCTGGAIEQIKDRKYPTIVSEFTGDILLVGINYDKKTKKHECRIEKWEKTQGVTGENSRSNVENSSSKREKSRSIKVDRIVEFCSEPKTLEEIAAFMGVKDKNFMKKMYIDPILGTRLRMTEPDSPTSPTQKYEALDGRTCPSDRVQAR